LPIQLPISLPVSSHLAQAGAALVTMKVPKTFC
jgi:hypothetical protein